MVKPLLNVKGNLTPGPATNTSKREAGVEC